MIPSKTTLVRRCKCDIDAGAVASGAPMSRDAVLELFDYIEEGLAITGCDHSFRCREAFLVANGIALRPALTWLRRHGASCDCAALDEVEQRCLTSSQGTRNGGGGQSAVPRAAAILVSRLPDTERKEVLRK